MWAIYTRTVADNLVAHAELPCARTKCAHGGGFPIRSDLDLDLDLAAACAGLDDGDLDGDVELTEADLQVWDGWEVAVGATLLVPDGVSCVR